MLGKMKHPADHEVDAAKSKGSRCAGGTKVIQCNAEHLQFWEFFGKGARVVNLLPSESVPNIGFRIITEQNFRLETCHAFKVLSCVTDPPASALLLSLASLCFLLDALERA